LLLPNKSSLDGLNHTARLRVLQDVWDLTKVADLVGNEGVTFTMASTTFLTNLTRVVSEMGEGVPNLRIFLCVARPIPRPLMETRH
jgi:cyclohexanecarboxylate-CoA ligase